MLCQRYKPQLPAESRLRLLFCTRWHFLNFEECDMSLSHLYNVLHMENLYSSSMEQISFLEASWFPGGGGRGGGGCGGGGV